MKSVFIIKFHARAVIMRRLKLSTEKDNRVRATLNATLSAFDGEGIFFFSFQEQEEVNSQEIFFLQGSRSNTRAAAQITTWQRNVSGIANFHPLSRKSGSGRE